MEHPPPPDWSRLRAVMVRTQVEGGGVRDRRVLQAMGRVERHRFVPESLRYSAYDDTPLPIGHGQTISQPLMVALMTEALGLKGGEKILEVGTGSGYQAAVLAEMGCVVFTVERDPLLAEGARRLLAELGYLTVHVRQGDGTLGFPEEAPFDGIIVTAGAPRVPESLKAQLDPGGGTLVIPVGEGGYQELLRVRRHGEEYRSEELGGCRFVPLVGREGWPE